jgi:hypothetical protein
LCSVNWSLRLSCAFRNPLHGGQRNFKFAIAKSADSNGENLTEPFRHPKMAFRHGFSQFLKAFFFFTVGTLKRQYFLVRLIAGRSKPI